MSVATYKQLGLTGDQTNAFLVASTVVTALMASGLTQTADAGQMVLTNAAAYGGGYQLWGFNDSLQSSAPFYCKFVFAGDSSRFTFQFGTSTDGAGNVIEGVTGSLSPVFTLYTPQTNLPCNCYFSGDTNRFAMVLCSGYIVYEEMTISFERTKTKLAIDTSEGLLILCVQKSKVPSSLMLPSTRSAYDQGVLGTWSAAMNVAQPSMATQDFVGFAFPICFNIVPYNPGINFLLYQGTDMPGYTTQSIQVFGVWHNYYVMSPNGADPTTVSYYGDPGIGFGAHLMMRYE